MPETKEESLTQTAGAKVVCVPAAGQGPSERPRRTAGTWAVKSPWGGKLGREEESGGVAQREEGRGVRARAGAGGGGSVFAERWGNR